MDSQTPPPVPRPRPAGPAPPPRADLRPPQPLLSPAVPAALRSPLGSPAVFRHHLRFPAALTVPLPQVRPGPPAGMSRATGPERRLLAIYTGGTIGMRSEHGSELRRPGEGAAPGAVGGIILELSSPREAAGPAPRSLWAEVHSSGERERTWRDAPGPWRCRQCVVGSGGPGASVRPRPWANTPAGRCLGAARPLTRTAEWLRCDPHRAFPAVLSALGPWHLGRLTLLGTCPLQEVPLRSWAVA